MEITETGRHHMVMELVFKFGVWFLVIAIGARTLMTITGVVDTTLVKYPRSAEQWCLSRAHFGPIATDGLDFLGQVLIIHHTGGRSVRR